MVQGFNLKSLLEKKNPFLLESHTSHIIVMTTMCMCCAGVRAAFLAQVIMDNWSTGMAKCRPHINAGTSTENHWGGRRLQQLLRGHVESLVLLKGHCLSPDRTCESQTLHFSLDKCDKGTVLEKSIKAFLGA